MALEILTEHRAVLDRLADALLEQETVDKPEVERLLADATKRPQRTADPRGGGLAVARRAVRPGAPPARGAGGTLA